MSTPQNYPYPGQPQVPARPKSLDTSFLLWLVSAALGIVGTLLAFATAGDLAEEQTRGQLEDAGLPSDSLEGVDGAVATGVGIGVFIGLAIFIAWIAIVFQMRNGKNWARIVLAVLGGLGILGGLIGLFGIAALFSVGFLGVLQGLLNLAQLVVVIAAIVFMFKPDANQYFRRA
ncbi:MAG: hypothetical protein ACRDSE_12690 [Pseudonocardiaceae bacterium]